MLDSQCGEAAIGAGLHGMLHRDDGRTCGEDARDTGHQRRLLDMKPLPGGIQVKLLVSGVPAGKQHGVEGGAGRPAWATPTRCAEAEPGAQRLDEVDLRIQQLARQAVFGNGIAQRAAGLFMLVENQAGVAPLLQIIRAASPAGRRR